ncbi:MAG: SRPBCC domain-containing protein [Gemmatimonadota bacterium]
MAIVFGIEGVWAGVTMLNNAIHGQVKLNLGVLAVAVAVGLLHLSESAYRWAKRMLWFAVVALGIFLLLLLFSTGEVTTTRFGKPVEPTGALALWGLLIGSAVQTFWQLKVLGRNDVKELFEGRVASAMFQQRRRAQFLMELRAHEEATRQQALFAGYMGPVVMTCLEPGLVTASRPYDVPPEQVFNQWLDPDCMRRFLVDSVDGTGVRASSDVRMDGHFSVSDMRGDWRVEHKGVYVEILRASRLVFLYSFNRKTTYARVTLDIVATAGGCALTLTQQGHATWREPPQEAAVRWAGVLDNLDRQLRLRSTNV